MAQTGYGVNLALFCVLGIPGNLALALAVLLIPALRQSPQHVITLNLACACAIMAALVLPLEAEAKLEGAPRDCRVHVTVVTSQLLLTAVTLLLVTSACVTHALTFVLTLSHAHRYVAACVMSALCWFLSCAVLLPVLFLTGHEFRTCAVGDDVITAAENASSVTSTKVDNSVLILVRGPGLFMTVVGLVLVLLLHGISARARRKCPGEPRGDVTSFPADVVLAAVVVLLTQLPVLGLTAAGNVCTSHACAQTVRPVTETVAFLYYALNPFIWLLCSRTRAEIKKAFSSR